MGRSIKYLLIGVAVLAALLLVAIIAFSLLFDPNNYRDEIGAQVKTATGRDLVIEGDLGLKLFPWVAIEMGETRLGNAAGFGEQAFLEFTSAELSVRLLPMLLRREVQVGTARLDGLTVNLAVDSSGRSNWQDLIDRQEAAEEVEAAPAETGQLGSFEVGSLQVNDAALVYDNRQVGEQYQLAGLNIATGAVRAGQPVDLQGNFTFTARTAGISGDIEISSVVSFEDEAATVELVDSKIEGTVNGVVEGDVPVPFSLKAPRIRLATAERMASPGQLEFSALDIDGTLAVEPFSYAGDPMPVAQVSIDAFSPRSLMQSLQIDAPETADPAALGKLLFDGKAAVGKDSIRLTGMTLVIDDTTFKGELSVPSAANGTYHLALAGDTMNLDRYMAPADEAASTESAAAEPPLEIPVDMIRAFNVRGDLTLASASLGGMQFDNIAVGVNNRNGQLRVHPVSADFFEGSYQGDIRIDASGNTATLSVNEKIQNVSLASMAKAMLERENITGLINGSFVLSGRGNNMADIQKTLSGNLSFTMSDGAYEGTDVWYELRRARAMFRKEEPPEPVLPARTPFSKVSATGIVTDGVMRNDDFLAELPFMQLSGRGNVNLVSTDIDYSLSGRVFDRPEFVNDASADEIADLTKAVIPLRISGTLAAPKIGVDFESLLKGRVQEELRDRLLDKLGGGDEEEESAEGESEEKDAEDILKDRLKDLLGR